MQSLINLVEEKRDKFQIIELWLGKEDSNVKLGELQSLTDLVEERNKFKIIELWLKKEANNVKFDQIQSLIDLVENDKYKIAEFFIDKKGKTLNFDQFKSLIGFVYEYNKFNIIETWINTTSHDFKMSDIVSLTEFVKEKYQKPIIIDRALEKKEYKLEFDELQLLIESKVVNAYKLNDIIKKWFKTEEYNIDINQFKSIVKLLLLEKDKFEIIELWLGKEGNNVDIEQLKLIINLLGGYNKNYIIARVFETKLNEQSKCELFIQYINDTDLFETKYDFNQVARLHIEFGLPSSTIINICEGLYPNNEGLQAELIKSFIYSGRVIRQEKIEILKNFINKLQENDIVIDLLGYTQNRLNLEEKDILEIVGQRVQSQYQSISDIFSDKTIENSLTPEGIEQFKALFGFGEGEDIDKNISIANLFSYYDVKGNMNGFINMVKPEILDEIKEKFKTNSKKPYITASEYKKLKPLIGRELPSMSILCEYLSSKVPELSNLTEEVISKCTINFEGSSLTEEEKEDLLGRFKTLLHQQDYSTEEVTRFFSDLLQFDVEINEANQRKLTDFFKHNKKELVHIFGEEGGLVKFSGLLGSLLDGCVANIATQMQITLNQSLINEPYARKLYEIFSEKISQPILNSGGDHLGGRADNINVFDINIIKNSVISANGLVAELTKILCNKDGDISKESTKILMDYVGEENFPSFNEAIGEKVEELDLNFEDEFKESAKLSLNALVYIIIKESIPELLNEPELQDFVQNLAGKDIIDEPKQQPPTTTQPTSGTAEIIDKTNQLTQ